MWLFTATNWRCRRCVAIANGHDRHAGRTCRWLPLLQCIGVCVCVRARAHKNCWSVLHGRWPSYRSRAQSSLCDWWCISWVCWAWVWYVVDCALPLSIRRRRMYPRFVALHCGARTLGQTARTQIHGHAWTRVYIYLGVEYMFMMKQFLCCCCFCWLHFFFFFIIISFVTLSLRQATSSNNNWFRAYLHTYTDHRHQENHPNVSKPSFVFAKRKRLTEIEKIKRAARQYTCCFLSHSHRVTHMLSTRTHTHTTRVSKRPKSAR